MVQCIEILWQVKNHSSCISLFCILLYLLNCFFRTSSRTVSKTSIWKLRLIDRYQLLWHCLLDDAVYDGRNTELSYSAIWLWNLRSSDRRWGIMPFSYSLRQFMAVFPQPQRRLFNGHSIYSRRSLVCLHSLVSSVEVVLIQYLT